MPWIKSTLQELPPDSIWLLKARGEKCGRNAPSLPRCAPSVRELRGHRANQHHENMISMSLMCDSNLCYAALLMCLSCLLRSSTLWGILDQCLAAWVNQTCWDSCLLCWDMCPSPAEPTSNSIHICLQIHTLTMGLWGPSGSPLLCVWLLLCPDYMLGWGWVWASPGLTQGHKWGGLAMGPGPQCIGNTAGLLVIEANPRELGGQWGGRGWDFYSFTGLYCFLKFSQPHSETRAGLSVGKGKDSVLFSMVCILSYMQYALWNGCCFELQS